MRPTACEFKLGDRVEVTSLDGTPCPWGPGSFGRYNPDGTVTVEWSDEAAGRGAVVTAPLSHVKRAEPVAA